MKLTIKTLPMYCRAYGRCLHWAQGTNGAGYPQCNVGGKAVLVRRHVYRDLLGKPLAPRQPIVSQCGHRLCVTPGCLRVTSQSRLLADCYADGRRGGAGEYLARLAKAQTEGWTKLDWGKVDEIRALPLDMTDIEIGRLYGVHAKTVQHVRAGKSWRTAANASSVFAWRPAA
jgi:hypothetical protein